MNWLAEKRSDPTIEDDQYRVLEGLICEFLSNENDWCELTDAALAKACGKGVSTIRRITKELKQAGHLHKRKQLLASRYSFPGLTEDLPHMRGQNEIRPLTCEQKTSDMRAEDLSLRGSTITFFKPSLGSASPSPLDSAASASPDNNSSLNAQPSFSPSSPPYSAPPPSLSPEERQRGLARLEGLSDYLKSKGAKQRDEKRQSIQRNPAATGSGTV
jgi:hypothetical protein